MATLDTAETPSITLEEVANDGSSLTNPNADHRRLFLGEDGLLHVKDSGGTVTSPYSSSGIAATIVDAKGDLIAATAADTVARLPVGTDGQVLTAASGQSTGLQWATVAAGAVTIKGRVAANGTITAGTGFSVTQNSTGDYTVTFTSAFAAVPVVFVTAVDGGLGTRKTFVRDVTTGDFDLAITNFGGSNSDSPFHFLAQAI
jgi:hypothetical protein